MKSEASKNEEKNKFVPLPEKTLACTPTHNQNSVDMFTLLYKHHSATLNEKNKHRETQRMHALNIDCFSAQC